MQPSRWVFRGLYLFAAVLIVIPMLDLISTVLPARPGDFSWRYGVLGLMAGYLHTPMLGVALAFGLGVWLQHRWVLRAGGLLAMLSSVALLGVMAIFALDVVQMRGMRPEEVQSAVLAGGLLQEIKYLTAALVLAPLGYGAWRTGGQMRRGRSDTPGIVARGRPAS